MPMKTWYVAYKRSSGIANTGSVNTALFSTYWHFIIVLALAERKIADHTLSRNN